MSRLDRNTSPDGRGKYALILMREIAEKNMKSKNDIACQLEALERFGVIDYGEAGTGRDFFVLRLKDPNAEVTLRAYAESIRDDDAEFAGEVSEMADRAASIAGRAPTRRVAFLDTENLRRLENIIREQDQIIGGLKEKTTSLEEVNKQLAANIAQGAPIAVIGSPTKFKEVAGVCAPSAQIPHEEQIDALVAQVQKLQREIDSLKATNDTLTEVNDSNQRSQNNLTEYARGTGKYEAPMSGNDVTVRNVIKEQRDIIRNKDIELESLRESNQRILVTNSTLEAQNRELHDRLGGIDSVTLTKSGHAHLVEQDKECGEWCKMAQSVSSILPDGRTLRDGVAAVLKRIHAGVHPSEQAVEFYLKSVDLPPDNDFNVWHDWNKLFVLSMRVRPDRDEVRAVDSAFVYFLFGNKHANPAINVITAEQANDLCAKAYLAKGKQTPCLQVPLVQKDE